MNMLSSLKNDSIPIKSKILGKSKTGKNLDIFTEIYKEDTNIVIWQRRLQKKIIEAASSALLKAPDLELSEIVTSQTIDSILEKSLSSNLIYQPVIKDISSLVDIFCNLFFLWCMEISSKRRYNTHNDEFGCFAYDYWTSLLGI